MLSRYPSSCPSEDKRFKRGGSSLGGCEGCEEGRPAAVAMSQIGRYACGRIGNSVRPGPGGRRGLGDAMLPRNFVYRPAGAPSSLATSPVPRPSPQSTPASLPYRMRRRLSSTRHRRAPPCCGPRWQVAAVRWGHGGAAAGWGAEAGAAGGAARKCRLNFLSACQDALPYSICSVHNSICVGRRGGAKTFEFRTLGLPYTTGVSQVYSR